MLLGAEPKHIEYAAMQEALKKGKKELYIFIGQELMIFQENK